MMEHQEQWEKEFEWFWTKYFESVPMKMWGGALEFRASKAEQLKSFIRQLLAKERGEHNHPLIVAGQYGEIVDLDATYKKWLEAGRTAALQEVREKIEGTKIMCLMCMQLPRRTLPYCDHEKPRNVIIDEVLALLKDLCV